MVKTLHTECRGTGSIPGRGTKIPRACQVQWPKKKKKKMSEEAPAFMLHSLHPGHPALLIGGMHPGPLMSSASLVP